MNVLGSCLFFVLTENNDKESPLLAKDLNNHKIFV